VNNLRPSHMNLSKVASFLLCLLSSSSSIAGDSAKTAKASESNRFARFFGEWTLKDDAWSQNWGGGSESIKIENHHTLCRPINTDNSVICVVDTPPKGHILWAFNPVTKEVHHLSSFGDLRIGVGSGSLNEKGNLRLKVSFEGEAPGTYRIYDYVWISDGEYDMRSRQYDVNGKETGLFYGGRFIRK
jgi:hypothetical protein